ncbi:MAG: tRNA lysidine(34) synthetase TilS [Pseudomonadota bacterium]
MAASRKRPSASARPAIADVPVVASAKALLAAAGLRGKRVAVGFSGGVDSVVLLNVLHALAPVCGYKLSAIHVNHGLSPNAGDWQQFCCALCLEWKIPFAAVRVNVQKQGRGLEAAARDARRAAFEGVRADAIVLAHHLDDQAETVLLNLLRGAGLEGASGMPALGRLGRKLLLRPLLEVPRSAIRAYADEHRLPWIEDESNADEALTRNFIRRRIGPLLESRFRRWRENLARAARHFAGAGLDARAMLRAYLKEQGLRAPSEAKLIEMLKQLGGRGENVKINHDGVDVRVYRGKVKLLRPAEKTAFKPMSWHGEARLAVPALGGELRFRRVRGQGIDSALLKKKSFQVRLRSGGERLRTDARRPRRTLKNLFQEAGVPPWERERLPLLYCGDDLVWVPGLGVNADYVSAGRATGFLPEWCRFVA